MDDSLFTFDRDSVVDVYELSSSTSRFASSGQVGRIIYTWTSGDLYDVIKDYLTSHYGWNGLKYVISFTKVFMYDDSNDGIIKYNDLHGGIGNLQVDDIVSRIRDKKLERLGV